MRLNKLSLLTLGAAASLLLLPGLAMAQGAGILIDEGAADETGQLTFTPTNANLVNFTSHVDAGTNGESGGFHGEYTTATPLGIGQVISAQAWLMDPPGSDSPGSIGDWVQITFTGNPNNVISVDGTFLSDGGGIPIPPVTNPAFVVMENIDLKVNNGFTDVNPALRLQGAPLDFHTSIRSLSVPEPGSVAMLVGMTLSGSLLARRRIKKR